MRTDVSLGGYILTKEEWDALDDDARFILIHACVQTSRDVDVAESYYESYELEIDKLAS